MDKFTHRDELIGGAQVERVAYPALLGTRVATRNAGGQLLIDDVANETLTLAVLDIDAQAFTTVNVTFQSDLADHVTAAITAALSLWMGGAEIRDGRVAIFVRDPRAASLSALPSGALTSLGMVGAPHPRATSTIGDYAEAATTRGGEDGVGAYIVPFEDRTSTSINRAVDAVARNTSELETLWRAPEPHPTALRATALTLNVVDAADELNLHASQRSFYQLDLGQSAWVGADVTSLRATDAVAAALPGVDISPLTRVLSAHGRTDAHIAQRFLALRAAHSVTPPAPTRRAVIDVRDVDGAALLPAARTTPGGHERGDAVLLRRQSGSVTASGLGGDITFDGDVAVSAALCGTALAPRVRIDARQLLTGVAQTPRTLLLDLSGAEFTAFALVDDYARTGELVAMTSGGVFEVTHVRTDGLLTLRPWAGDLNDFFLLPKQSVTRGGVVYPAPTPLVGRTQLLTSGAQLDVILLAGRVSPAQTVRTVIHVSNVPERQAVIVVTDSVTRPSAMLGVVEDYSRRALRSATGDVTLAPMSLADAHGGPSRVTLADDGAAFGAGAALRERVTRGGRDLGEQPPELRPLPSLEDFYVATRDDGPGVVIREFLARRTASAAHLAAIANAVSGMGHVVWTQSYDPTRAYHPDDNDVLNPAQLRSIYELILRAMPASPRVSATYVEHSGNTLQVSTPTPLSSFDCGRLFTLRTDVFETAARLLCVAGRRALFQLSEVDAALSTYTLQLIPHYGLVTGADAVRVDVPDAAYRRANGALPRAAQTSAELSSFTVIDVRGGARRALDVTTGRLQDARAHKLSDNTYTIELPVAPEQAAGVRRYALSTYPARIAMTGPERLNMRDLGLFGAGASEPVVPSDVLDMVRASGITIDTHALLLLVRYRDAEMPAATGPGTPADRFCGPHLNDASFDMSAAELLLAPLDSGVERAMRAINATPRLVNTAWLNSVAALQQSPRLDEDDMEAASALLRGVIFAGGSVQVGERALGVTGALTASDVTQNALITITPSSSARCAITLRGARVGLAGVDADCTLLVTTARISVDEQSPQLPIVVRNVAVAGLTPLTTARGAVQIVGSNATSVVYRYSGFIYTTGILSGLSTRVPDDNRPTLQTVNTFPVSIRSAGASIPGFMFYAGVGVRSPRLLLRVTDAEHLGSDETRAALQQLRDAEFQARAAIGLVARDVVDAGVTTTLAAGLFSDTRVIGGGTSAERPLRVHVTGDEGAVAGFSASTDAPNTAAIDVSVSNSLDLTEYDGVSAYRALHVRGGSSVSPESPVSARQLYTLREGMTGIASEHREYQRLPATGALFSGPTALVVGNEPRVTPAPARLNVNATLYRAQLWVSGYSIESAVQYGVHGALTTGVMAETHVVVYEDELSYSASVRGLLSVNGVLSLAGDGRQSLAAYHNIAGSASISGVQGHVNPIIAPRAGGATAHAHPNATSGDYLPADVRGVYSGLGVFTSDGTSVLSAVANSALTRALPPPNTSCPDIRKFLPHAAQQLGERVAVLRIQDTLTSDASLLIAVRDTQLEADTAFGYLRRVDGLLPGLSSFVPKTGLLRAGYIPAATGTSDMLVLFFTRAYFDFAESVVGRSVRISLTEVVGTQTLTTPTLDGVIAAVNTATVSGGGDYVRVMLAPPPQRNFIAQDPSLGVFTAQSRWYNIGATRGVLPRLTISQTLPPSPGARVTLNMLVHGREWSLNAYRVNLSDRLRVLDADGRLSGELRADGQGGVSISATEDMNLTAGGSINIAADSVNIDAQSFTVNGLAAGFNTVSVNVTTLIRPEYYTEVNKTDPTVMDVARVAALYTRTQEDYLYNGEPAPVSNAIPSTALLLPHRPRRATGPLSTVRVGWDYSAQNADEVSETPRLRVFGIVAWGIVPIGAVLTLYGSVKDAATGLQVSITEKRIVADNTYYEGAAIDFGYVTLQNGDIFVDGVDVPNSALHILGITADAAAAQAALNADRAARGDACELRRQEIQDFYYDRLRDELDAAGAVTGGVDGNAQADWDEYVERVESAQGTPEADILREYVEATYADEYEDYEARYEEAVNARELHDSAVRDMLSFATESPRTSSEIDEALAEYLEAAYDELGITQAQYEELQDFLDDYVEYGSVVHFAVAQGFNVDEAFDEWGGKEAYEELRDTPYDISSSEPDPAWLADNGYIDPDEGVDGVDGTARSRAEDATTEEYDIDAAELERVLHDPYYCAVGQSQISAVAAATSARVDVSNINVDTARRFGVLTGLGWCNWFGVRAYSRRHAVDAQLASLRGNADGTSDTKYPLTALLAALRYPIIHVPTTARVVSVNVTPVLSGPNADSAHIGEYTRVGNSPRLGNLPAPRALRGRDADGHSEDKWERGGETPILTGWRVVSPAPALSTGGYEGTVTYYAPSNIDERQLVRHTAGPTINIAGDEPRLSGEGDVRATPVIASTRAVKLQLDFDVEALFDLIGACHPQNVPPALATLAASAAIQAKNYAAVDALLPPEVRIAFRIDVGLHLTPSGGDIEG